MGAWQHTEADDVLAMPWVPSRTHYARLLRAHVLREVHQATPHDAISQTGHVVDGEGCALPSLHSNLQDWIDPGMAHLAVLVPIRLQL